MSNKEVVLTGIRSNAEPTLGNYLGAMLPLVRVQKEQLYQINAFLPDLHSIVTPVKNKNFYENTLAMLRYIAAAGLDLSEPSTFIYRQSFIPAHSELAWIIDCFSYYGELSRMTQFKDRSQKGDSVSVGMFNYPALMAADILLYDAKFVPVGEDQRQHLELARDIAIRMNNQFGELFTIPEPWESQLKFNKLASGLRIRSLKHPDAKMSKSIADPSGTILLADSPDSAKNKIYEATTDSLGKIDFDFKTRPGISNLLQIVSLLENRSLDQVIAEWKGKPSYGDLKNVVATKVAEFMLSYQLKLSSISDDQLLKALAQGEKEMNEVAKRKLYKVQQAVGLRPSST